MDTKVLELLAVFALATDKAGRICWLNAHNARANGVKPRDVIGKRPREVWPEARADEAYDAEVRRTRKPVEHLAFARTRTGRAVWLRVVRSLLPGGKVLTVGVDVTGEVRRGAMASLVSLANRAGRSTPAPSAVDKAVASAFVDGADALELLERGTMPNDLARIATTLML